MRMATSLTQHRHPRGRGHPRHLGQSPDGARQEASPGVPRIWMLLVQPNRPQQQRRRGEEARGDPDRQPGRPGGKEGGGGDRAGQCPEFSIVVASTLTALSSAGERTSHGMMAISSGRYVLASIALAAARAMTTTTGPWTAATAAPPSSSARIPVATRSSSSRRTW
jgi:hypothetical protein